MWGGLSKEGKFGHTVSNGLSGIKEKDGHTVSNSLSGIKEKDDISFHSIVIEHWHIAICFFHRHVLEEHYGSFIYKHVLEVVLETRNDVIDVKYRLSQKIKLQKILVQMKQVFEDSQYWSASKKTEYLSTL